MARSRGPVADAGLGAVFLVGRAATEAARRVRVVVSPAGAAGRGRAGLVASSRRCGRYGAIPPRGGRGAP